MSISKVYVVISEDTEQKGVLIEGVYSDINKARQVLDDVIVRFIHADSKDKTNGISDKVKIVVNSTDTWEEHVYSDTKSATIFSTDLEGV